MSDSKYFDAFINGYFYCPASKHYNFAGAVSCDRCKQNNILVCVGYTDTDLCLACMAELEKTFKERIEDPVQKRGESSSVDKETVKRSPGLDPLYPKVRNPYWQDEFVQTLMMSEDYYTNNKTPIESDKEDINTEDASLKVDSGITIDEVD